MDLGQCSFEEVNSLAKNIEGWFSDSEAKLLYSISKNLKGIGAVVEIGSWCSKSITYIAAGVLKAGLSSKIFCIDPFLTSKNESNGRYEIFVENLKKHNLYDRITHIKEKSQIAGQKFDEKIELIFIDGFHQYDFVRKDFELFYPKVVEGGYLAMHDVGCYKGPTVLMKEVILSSDNCKVITYEDLTLVIQKVAFLTEEDIINNKKFVDIIDEKIKTESLLV